jgi:hypothetical protein
MYAYKKKHVIESKIAKKNYFFLLFVPLDTHLD